MECLFCEGDCDKNCDCPCHARDGMILATCDGCGAPTGAPCPCVTEEAPTVVIG